MSTLGNAVRRHTTLRLEKFKSYALGLRFVHKETGLPIDLTDCEIRMVVRNPRRKGGAVQIDSVATLIDADLGLAQFSLQASDVDLAPGEYPFAIGMRTALDYSVALIKGTVEILDNTIEQWQGDVFPATNPNDNLLISMKSGDIVELAIDALDGHSLRIQNHIDEFEDALDVVQALLDGKVAAAEGWAGSAQTAAAQAEASADNAVLLTTGNVESSAANAVAAYGHKMDAADSAQTATNKAAEASNSAVQASNFATEAGLHADEAEAQADLAETRQIGATASAGIAVQARNEANSYRDDAENFANDAQLAATAADASAAAAAASAAEITDPDFIHSRIAGEDGILKGPVDGLGNFTLTLDPDFALPPSFSGRQTISAVAGQLEDLEELTMQMSFPAGYGWLLRRVQVDAPCRVRVYGSNAMQIADQARAIGVVPTGNHGLFVELIFEDPLYELVLSPAVHAYNLSGGGNNLYVSLQNIAGETLNSAAHFDYVRTE